MSEQQLGRSLGAGTLTLIGIGSVIGAGIFVVTGQAAAVHAGPAIVFSFVLAAIACVFSALCYAEMATMVPLAGSGYSYAREAFGRNTGWIVGWALLAEYLFATAAIAIGWSAYMQGVIGDFGLHVPAAWATSPLMLDGLALRRTGSIINLPAVLIIALITASHLSGVKESVRFNMVAIGIKLSAVLLFIVVGLAHVDVANWTPFVPPVETRPDGTLAYGVPGIVHAAGVVFFAYLGFDALASAAQETRNPQRDMPFAILVTLGITTLLYILVALVMTGLVDFRTLGTDAPLTTALGAVGESVAWLKTYVGVAVTIGLWASLWSTVFALSRLLYSFGRDGLLARAFAVVSPVRLVPRNAVLVSGAAGMAVAGFLPISLLGELISTGTLLAFAVVCAAVIRLRVIQPDRPRPFRVPAWQIIAPLGIAASLFLLVGMGWFALLRIAAWQLLGLLLLLTMVWRRRPA